MAHRARKGDRVVTVRTDPGVQPTDEQFDQAWAHAWATRKAKLGK